MTDERKDGLLSLIPCPKCGKDRHIGKTGLACEWNCGGVHLLSPKELSKIKRLLKSQEKKDAQQKSQRYEGLYRRDNGDG